jgi:predicted Ser/Thr protein kinase
MMHVPAVRQLLACNIQHDGHLHRFLFDDETVRYVKITGGPHTHHVHDGMLPTIPTGNWNWATVDTDRETGQLFFQTAVTRELEKVTVAYTEEWNPPSVDHLHLQIYQGENRDGRFATYRDSPCNIFGCPIVVKIARFGHEIPDIQKECDFYKLIQGQGIGSKFLAYVTEGGRTIGFVLKKIEDTKPLRPRDFTKCKRVLKRFHRLGFLHQDCHDGNVLMSKGRATLLDFKSATEINDSNAVEGKLQDFAALRAACGISRQTDEDIGETGDDESEIQTRSEPTKDP